jgi:hypothetical protein
MPEKRGPREKYIETNSKKMVELESEVVAVVVKRVNLRRVVRDRRGDGLLGLAVGEFAKVEGPVYF